MEKLLTHHKTSKFEEWYEYDERGNLIHLRNTRGYEEWHKYDDRNNLIYTKNNEGFEETYQFNTDNEIIKDISFVNGELEDNLVYEYDANHNPIHIYSTVDSSYDMVISYNEKNQIVSVVENQKKSHYLYNEKGLLIYYFSPWSYDTYYYYDEKDRLVKEANVKPGPLHTNIVYEIYREFDDNDNCIHIKDTKGWEKWLEYDESGNTIHTYDNEEYEVYNEFEEIKVE